MTAWPAIAEPFSVEALERACPELMAALCERARATVIAQERARIRAALPAILLWPELADTIDRVLFVAGGTRDDLALAMVRDLRHARQHIEELKGAGVRPPIPDERKPQ